MLLCDLAVIRRQLPRVMIATLFVAVMVCIAGLESGVVVPVVIMMGVYYVTLTLAAFDDRDGWAAFRLALPLSRGDVVLGRYATTMITCLAFAVLGIALAAVAWQVAAAQGTEGILSLAVVGMAFSLTYMAIVLPVYFRVGTTRGARIVAMLMCMIPLAVVGFGDASVVAGFITGSEFLVLFPVVALVLFAASAVVSLRLYDSRDL
jgi:ABC-2 type transport system permease protein